MRRALGVGAVVFVVMTIVVIVITIRTECHILAVSTLEQISEKIVIVDQRCFEPASLYYTNVFNRKPVTGELVTVAEFNNRTILCFGEVEAVEIRFQWFWVHLVLFGVVLSVCAGLLTNPVVKEVKKLFKS